MLEKINPYSVLPPKIVIMPATCVLPPKFAGKKIDINQNQQLDPEVEEQKRILADLRRHHGINATGG